MFVQSVWLETNAFTDELQSAAQELGANLSDPAGSSSGLVHQIAYTFIDRRDTPWEASTVSGTWYAALVELSVKVSGDRVDRLVGIVGPRMSLVQDVFTQLQDLLDRMGLSHDRTEFTLRQLLDSEAIAIGIQPVSVRLRRDGATTLLKADSWQVLRDTLTNAQGSLVGVTVRARGEVLSILPGGAIVFDESSPAGIIEAVSAVERALSVPELA